MTGNREKAKAMQNLNVQLGRAIQRMVSDSDISDLEELIAQYSQLMKMTGDAPEKIEIGTAAVVPMAMLATHSLAYQMARKYRSI